MIDSLRLLFMHRNRDSNNSMQQSGGLLLAAGLDGGDTMIQRVPSGVPTVIIKTQFVKIAVPKRPDTIWYLVFCISERKGLLQATVPLFMWFPGR